MMTGAVVIMMSWPILVVLGLLALGAWRDRRREAMVARQIWLTDAIADELGAIVAPVVTKPLRRPWRAVIQVPIDQPAAVGRIVAIAHRILTRGGASRYQLVLTPGVAPLRSLKILTQQPVGCTLPEEGDCSMRGLVLAAGPVLTRPGVLRIRARRQGRAARATGLRVAPPHDSRGSW